MESERMLTPREKSPLPEKFSPRGGSNPRRCIWQNSEPNTLPVSYSGPQQKPFKGRRRGKERRQMFYSRLQSKVVLRITLTGAILDFLQSPHWAANCLQRAHSSSQARSCAIHVQHIGRSSRACRDEQHCSLVDVCTAGNL